MPKDALFQIVEDGLAEDDEEKAKRVGRLTDMDTREVSIVDRAANKRTFLVIKRDEVDAPKNPEEEDPMPADALETQTPATQDPTTQVDKGVFAARIDEVLARTATLKGAIDAAESAEQPEAIPSKVAAELRAIQFTLKGLAGVSRGAGLLVPAATDLSDVGPIGAKTKKAATKVLDDVAKRLEALKADLGEAELLDAVQAQKLDASADLVAKVSIDLAGEDDSIVLRSSLDDAQRDVVLEAIEKALDGLSALYVGLQTDAVVKNTRVAREFEVGSILHDAAATVEKAVADVVTAGEDRDPIFGTVEALREIQKVVGAERPEVLGAVRGVVAEIAKAAQLFEVRWGSDKHRVVLATASETVAEFDTNLEAEADALRRNMEMVAGLMKRYVVREEDGQHAVVDSADDGEVAKFDSAETAQSVAARMNLSAAKVDPQEEDDDVSKTETKPKPADDTTTNTDEDVAKIGRPMQSDRLGRLKGAVTLLKDALGDLRAGSVSLEKFKKVGSVLDALINELQVAKAAVRATGIQSDVRGLTPDAPNVGSGIQPDTSTVAGPEAVTGDGTPSLTETLKKLQGEMAEVRKALSTKDEEISSLKETNKDLRKKRSAPSTVPADAGQPVAVGKAQADDGYWPRDMNDWNG